MSVYSRGFSKKRKFFLVVCVLHGLATFVFADWKVGDFDGNLKVDFQDFIIFSQNYGRLTADLGVHQPCDLDLSGQIDMSDFIIFADVFGNRVDVSNPIMFVTQVPIPIDFATIGSEFANHLPRTKSTGRGGGLWIRYPDGVCRNLTKEAGYGEDGLQGEKSIAVRQPSISWDGKKALFSMVVGAPDSGQAELLDRKWQIYEIRGFGKNEKVLIQKVDNQPEKNNNISPVYAPNEDIIFVSDKPIREHLPYRYGQLDEYEGTPNNSGIWRIGSGGVSLLDAAPSGSFSPFVDSFGRVIFTRWDHLKYDDRPDSVFADYESETAMDTLDLKKGQLFPEEGQETNLFMPWEMNPDGTRLRTLNHLGRHELDDFISGESVKDTTFLPNSNSFEINLFHLREDPLFLGKYWATGSEKKNTHTSGRLLSFDAPPGRPADKIELIDRSHEYNKKPLTEFDSTYGFFRSPLPLTNGKLVVVHSRSSGGIANFGTVSEPIPSHRFRLKMARKVGGRYQATSMLTPGISTSVKYWEPTDVDGWVVYQGELWELDPVEVVARSVPPERRAILETPETKVFESVGIDPSALRTFLKEKDLALIVVRNVTLRDFADRQQPSNLKVNGSTTETTRGDGKVFSVSHLQMFQGDYIRGGKGDNANDRRVLPQFMNLNINSDTLLISRSRIKIASDGSAAAFVPARRPLTWQLLDQDETPIVRERVWLNFQPGEIRMCPACHGINSFDQVGRGMPTNQPEALRILLEDFKSR